MRCSGVPAVMLAIAALTASIASAHPTPRCGPANGHTLAGDGQARVYATSSGVFGCARGATEPIRLGGSTTNCIGTDRIGPVAVAGLRAAYASERCGIDTGSTEVVIRRLDTGAVGAAVPAGTPPGPESYSRVVTIVARASGSAAWTVVSQSIGRREATLEVWRVERGTARRLEAGNGIRTTSLRLRGRRLTWRNRAGVRSATLA